MLLHDIMKGYECTYIHQSNPTIKDISADSRQIKSAHVFVALLGYALDGHAFIEQAIKKGACAIIAQKNSISPHIQDIVRENNIACVGVDNPRHCLAYICRQFYGAGLKKNIAITGTNGKTSINSFIYAILTAHEKRCARIGTIDIRYADTVCPAKLTTPDTVSIHKYCTLFKQQECEYLVIEASSHALDQYRLDGLSFDVAAFTNLTLEHSDYHPSMAHYFAAKSRLFLELMHKKSGTAIVNIDDAYGKCLVDSLNQAGLACLRVGEGGNVYATQIKDSDLGQHLRVHYVPDEGKAEQEEVFIPLIGDFQRQNILITIACLLALKEMSFQEIVSYIPSLKGARGRFDCIGTYNAARVFIDYAHTPDALETVLKVLRKYCKNRLHIVFGCGGDRDKSKRPLMGSIAQKYCDVIYVTDDNPRNEEAAHIRAEILQASGDRAIEYGDRKVAIEKAMAALDTDDILLVAGKGHETGQIIHTITYPFDDYKIIQNRIDNPQ